MGGIGSGRAGFRRIAEHTKRIDIREWRRRGYLTGYRAFTWSWNIGGEPAGSIGVVTNTTAVILNYTILGDEPLSITERIALRNRPCHFGGMRQYLVCPRCGRAAELLYMASGRFRCRRCARVGYAIENLEKQWRADRRYRELETRLNDDGSKPQRMRWSTYDRICKKLDKYGAISEAGLARCLTRLMGGDLTGILKV